MAGEWIPREKGLNRKAEVLKIAELTGMNRYEVAERCCEIWDWADSQTENGIVSAKIRTLSAMLSTNEKFLKAMEQVGWLRIERDTIRIPKFSRWLGRCAKRRLKDMLRKRKQREKERKYMSAKSRTKKGQKKDYSTVHHLDTSSPPTPPKKPSRSGRKRQPRKDEEKKKEPTTTNRLLSKEFGFGEAKAAAYGERMTAADLDAWQEYKAKHGVRLMRHWMAKVDRPADMPQGEGTGEKLSEDELKRIVGE